MASSGLRIKSRADFYAFVGGIRDTNSALERRGTTEKVTYDFRLVRDVGGDRDRAYVVDVSHSPVELAALRVVLIAAERIGQTGGLQAGGARVDWGLRGLAASSRTVYGRLFTDDEVGKVWAAEKVLERRRRHAETFNALTAAGVPAGFIEAAR